MTQDRKQGAKQDRVSEENSEATPQGSAKTEGLDEDVDSMLAEIDDVLEENAEEFVKNYVQKGGQ